MILLRKLHKSLSQRKRPEDIALQISGILDQQLDKKEKSKLAKATKGALKAKSFGFTSMSQEFRKPVGAYKQITIASELFRIKGLSVEQAEKPEKVKAFIKEVNDLLEKEPGKNDFLQDRLNRQIRSDANMELSKRQYNKRWRLIKRLESKLETLNFELRKSEFEKIAKHGFAHHLSFDEFSKDLNSACFIAYYTARCNLRSEFTIDGQQRPFDEIAEMLLNRCLRHKQKSNWWAISHVFIGKQVVDELTEHEKGKLLGNWFSLLQELSIVLERLWSENDFNVNTMIVKQGNDSTTWNNTAGAWNKARDNWMSLIYALGLEYLLEEICFGKVLRLMAGDVAYWHRTSGTGLDPNTLVWNTLPPPWEVFNGTLICNKESIVSACKKAGLDPEKTGWITPRTIKAVKFKPTPELVHGVSVSDPFLASVLKKHKYYSGKKAKSFNPRNN